MSGKRGSTRAKRLSSIGRWRSRSFHSPSIAAHFFPWEATIAHGSWPMRMVRLLSVALATVIAMSMMPAFLLNVVVDLWRLNFARLAFHLPALYTVGVHSVLTHYIPRYNLPLFGVFAVELCLAAYFLWTLVVGSKDGQAEGVQSAT